MTMQWRCNPHAHKRWEVVVHSGNVYLSTHGQVELSKKDRIKIAAILLQGLD